MDVMSWRFFVAIFSVILMLPFTCYSEKAPNYSFVKLATSAPQISHFDYIIIGGGTSGCALTATLSTGAHVLLLERGGSPYGNPEVENVVGFGSNLDSSSLSSAAQPFTSEDGVVNARPRILGGGSAVNAGFYSRASPEYARRAGWDPALVNESYEWVEKKVAFKPEMLKFQSAFKEGLIEVGVTPNNGFTYNHIYGTKVGGTIFDANGKRHTAADLLEYAVPNRTNVYLFATVSKILFTSQEKPRAYGVLFMDTKGVKHKAFLKSGPKNEIILSGGAIGSPQILMLSGIGPKAHLRKLGIKVIVNGPLVGQGMSDNPMNAIMIPSPIPVEVSLIQAVGITHFDCYIEAASSTSFASAILHSFPTMSQSKMQNTYKTTSTSDNEDFYASLILEKTVGPKSKGHLFLKTTNPQDNPSVTFNYFKDQEDLNRCIKGMEIVIKVIESKSFSDFRDPELPVKDLLTTMLNLPLNQVPRGSNDTEFTNLGQFCRDTVMTIWHYHGGCQVGKVVDEDYKVYNVSGLRVIDGSTFIDSPGTNPQATVMMLGRYMGQRILEGRSGTSPDRS